MCYIASIPNVYMCIISTATIDAYNYVDRWTDIEGANKQSISHK